MHESLVERGLYADAGSLGNLQGSFIYESPVRIYLPCSIINSELGAFSYIAGGQSSSLMNCVIGRYCSIGHGVTLGASNHPMAGITSHPVGYQNIFPNHYPNYRPIITWSELPCKIQIDHGCWVGEGVSVSGSRSITIGRGAIVAAKSVVTRDVPPYAIVGGNPAKLIKYRFNDETISAVESTKWWDYDWYAYASQLNSNMYSNPPLLEVDLFVEWARLHNNYLESYRISSLMWKIIKNGEELILTKMPPNS